jgi:4-amino-4-deoxy-L-arabinose transferase-like glycosyltransferase
VVRNAVGDEAPDVSLRVRPSFVVRAAVLAAVATVLAIYVSCALRLVRYPWDWSIDEGLYLDWARRLVRAPSTLYDPATVVPMPCVYGPVLPLLLAPVVAATAHPLAGARLLALAWTLASATAVYVLVRREGSRTLAAAAAALSLTPLDLTYWSMLVRADGLMMTLWLLAAVALVPRRLTRGADRLSPGRLAAGSALVLVATLTKPTAAVHAAPLVLAWLLVDVRSAVTLAAAVGGGGLAIVGALQWATSGGFVAVARLWTLHPDIPGARVVIARLFLGDAWPLLVPAAAALLLARDRRLAVRDGSLALLLGSMAAAPLMGKSGAWWHYLLPAVPALAVLSGRWWGAARTPQAGAVVIAALAVTLATTTAFPLPTAEDERTAAALYGWVKSEFDRSRGPILVSEPNFAYFLVGQPVEIEGSSYMHLAAAQAPGTEKVLARLQRADYTLVILSWALPESGGYGEALDRSYRHAGGCDVRDPLLMTHVHLFMRRDLYRRRVPPPGTRCGPSITLPRPAPAASAAGHGEGASP